MPEEFGRQANPKLPSPHHEQGTPEHDAFVGGYMESVPAVASGTQPVTIPQGQWATYREKVSFKPHPAMVTAQLDSVTVWAAVFMADHLVFKRCVFAHDDTHGQYLRDA